MAAGHGGSVSHPLERPDLVHREVCILEMLGHFFSHLKTVRADGGAQHGADVLRVATVFDGHHLHGLFRDVQHRSFPSGVHGRHHLLNRVVQEDRYAIGRSYANGDALQGGHIHVVALQFFPGHSGTVYERHPGFVDLVSLDNRVGKV